MKLVNGLESVLSLLIVAKLLEDFKASRGGGGAGLI